MKMIKSNNFLSNFSPRMSLKLSFLSLSLATPLMAWTSPAGAQSSSLSVSSASAASPTTTSTASASTISAEARRLKVEFFNQSAIDFETLKSEKGTAKGVSNFLGVNYKIDDNSSVSFRQQFKFDYAGRSQPSSFKTDDLYVHYVRKNLLSFWNDASVEANFRTYLPTGMDSVESRQILALSPILKVKKPISKIFTLVHSTRPVFYLQSRPSFKSGDNKDKATRAFRLYQTLELQAALTSKLTFTQMIGTDNKYFHKGPSSSEIEFESSLEYALNNNASLTLGINQTSNQEAIGKYEGWLYSRNADTSLFMQLGMTI